MWLLLVGCRAHRPQAPPLPDDYPMTNYPMANLPLVGVAEVVAVGLGQLLRYDGTVGARAAAGHTPDQVLSAVWALGGAGGGARDARRARQRTRALPPPRGGGGLLVDRRQAPHPPGKPSELPRPGCKSRGPRGFAVSICYGSAVTHDA